MARAATNTPAGPRLVQTAFTTRCNVVIPARGVPVTVIGNEPGGVKAPVAMVSVLVQVGVQAVGTKVAVAPVGRPEATQVTACEIPATRVAVMVAVPV